MATNWAVLISAFLASTVEFVEAFTIVLVIGVTINWRSSIVGGLLAAGALAIIVAVLGPAIVIFIPINILRLVVGILLVLFGLKWLKKAILRYAGVKALHDEEAIYEEQVAEMKARGEVPHQGLDPFGVITSFKSVLLEGLEVAFIVITFGSATSTAVGGKGNSIGSAAIGAVAALVLVGGLGAIIRGPLARVPENTLKFVVGLMLTTFGTYWGGEGVGIVWPFNYDAFLLVLLAIYVVATVGLIFWLRPVGARARPHAVPQASTTPDAPLPAEQQISSDASR